MKIFPDLISCLELEQHWNVEEDTAKWKEDLERVEVVFVVFTEAIAHETNRWFLEHCFVIEETLESTNEARSYAESQCASTQDQGISGAKSVVFERKKDGDQSVDCNCEQHGVGPLLRPDPD